MKLTKDELETMPKNQMIDTILTLQKNEENLTKANEHLLEQLRIACHRTYGRKTETASSLYEQQQLDLGIFNEAEAEADNAAEEPDIEKAVPKKPKKKGDKAEKLKRITNRREEHKTLSVEELNQKYGEGEWKELPQHIIYKLEHHQEYFEVVEYHIHSYAKNDNQTIVRAPKPAELFPKCIATPSLIASFITNKYAAAVPLYRQESLLLMEDIQISRAVMASWIIKTSEEYLKYLFEAMKQELLKQRLLHADETPLQVTKDGRPAGSKSYMWVYRTNPEISEKNIVLYEYCKTRGSKNPEEFLKGFRGIVVCDGWGAYHKLEKEHPGEYKVAGCWVHLKRKFVLVVKIDGKKIKGTLASTAVKKIQKIFHEENKIEKLPPDQHLAKRQEVIKPLVDEFFEWIRQKRKYVDQSSETGKGFTYALNQEPYLRAFLDNPDIPMDNNYAEQAIRPFTVGRKNWVMIDTEKGAEASAVIYSIIETAKANNLRIYDYLKYVLEELMVSFSNGNHEIPERLLPWSRELPQELHLKYTRA